MPLRAHVIDQGGTLSTRARAVNGTPWNAASLAAKSEPGMQLIFCNHIMMISKPCYPIERTNNLVEAIKSGMFAAKAPLARALAMPARANVYSSLACPWAQSHALQADAQVPVSAPID